MPQCDNCGGHVSSAWARVTKVDGEIRGCPTCKNTSGAAEPGKSRFEKTAGDPIASEKL